METSAECITHTNIIYWFYDWHVSGLSTGNGDQSSGGAEQKALFHNMTSKVIFYFPGLTAGSSNRDQTPQCWGDVFTVAF